MQNEVKPCNKKKKSLAHTVTRMKEFNFPLA